MAKAKRIQYTAAEVLSASFDDTANTIAVSGGGASSTDGSTHTADSTTGTPIQGVYETSPTSLSNNELGTVGLDANRNQKTTLATLIAGEDLTNDVQKVEQRYSLGRATADAQIKSGAGFLHTLTFAQTDAAPTAGTIIVYDNTAESGTIIYSETFDTTVFRGYTVTLDVSFSTGLYIGFTTTADVGVTVSYR